MYPVYVHVFINKVSDAESGATEVAGAISMGGCTQAFSTEGLGAT